MWLIGIAIIVLVLEEAVRHEKRKVVVDDLVDTLLNALPSRLAQWAAEISVASEASCPPAVDQKKWAFAFAFLIDRESGGGNNLRPRGPAGLGDMGHGHGLGQVDDRPARAGAGDFETQLSDKRLAHIASGDWKVPLRHLLFCAIEVLRGAWDQFGDLVDEDERLRAALASYNAGVDNVRAQLDAGLDVDGATTHQDYSADVLYRAAAAGGFSGGGGGGSGGGGISRSD